MERESMEFDVVIVGGGPSGLSAAIKLAQLAAEKNREVSICIVEKGSEIGAHILSGAVLEPRALNELIPDWKDRGAPLDTPAADDSFVLLTKNKAIRLPTPPQMNNHGNYIISLGNLCRWLAEQAEAVGVEIYQNPCPGYPNLCNGHSNPYKSKQQVMGPPPCYAKSINLWTNLRFSIVLMIIKASISGQPILVEAWAPPRQEPHFSF